MSHETPSILIVDDDPVTCELCEVYRREGVAARFTQSGESEFAEIRSGNPDVLVSDILMKTRLDGLKLLEWVRRARPSLPSF